MKPGITEMNGDSEPGGMINITDFAKKSGVLDFLADEREDVAIDEYLDLAREVDRDKATVLVYKDEADGGEVFLVLEYRDKNRRNDDEYTVTLSELTEAPKSWEHREPMPADMYENLKSYLKINYPLLWVK